MREIDRQIGDINAHGHEDYECEANQQFCIVRSDQVGMIVRWKQQYGNSLDGSAIEVEECQPLAIQQRSTDSIARHSAAPDQS